MKKDAPTTENEEDANEKEANAKGELKKEPNVKEDKEAEEGVASFIGTKPRASPSKSQLGSLCISSPASSAGEMKRLCSMLTAKLTEAVQQAGRRAPIIATPCSLMARVALVSLLDSIIVADSADELSTRVKTFKAGVAMARQLRESCAKAEGSLRSHLKNKERAKERELSKLAADESKNASAKAKARAKEAGAKLMAESKSVPAVYKLDFTLLLSDAVLTPVQIVLGTDVVVADPSQPIVTDQHPAVQAGEKDVKVQLCMSSFGGRYELLKPTKRTSNARSPSTSTKGRKRRTRCLAPCSFTSAGR